MSVTTTQCIRKPLYVDAVRITGANFDAVADWCQGEIHSEGADHTEKIGKKFIRFRAHNPKNPRQTKAFVGDWLLYTERGYKVYTNRAFHASFDKVTATDEQPLEFPREEGDTVVIGPECFAAKDGEVLNWRGTNYVPQPGQVEKGTPEYTDSEEPYCHVKEDGTVTEGHQNGEKAA